MPTPTNPSPHPKPPSDVASELAAAALHGQSVEISAEGGKAVAEFFKAILAGISSR